jgi:hypothetical protein
MLSFISSGVTRRGLEGAQPPENVRALRLQFVLFTPLFISSFFFSFFPFFKIKHLSLSIRIFSILHTHVSKTIKAGMYGPSN